MAITSSDIQNQSFSIDRKGYDVDEVDVFLEHIASEIDEMNSTIAELEKDRIANASQAARELGSIICFKGNPTDCASPDGRAIVNSNLPCRRVIPPPENLPAC